MGKDFFHMGSIRLKDLFGATSKIGNETIFYRSYSAAICPTNRKDAGRGIGRITAELVIDYLQHQGHVSYQGVKRLTQK